MLSLVFVRSSSVQFKTYVEQLKSKVESITLSQALMKRAKDLDEILQSSEDWVSNAESHAQKVPGVKTYFQKLEDQMGSLLAQERVTRNPVVSRLSWKWRERSAVKITERTRENGVVPWAETNS